MIRPRILRIKLDDLAHNSPRQDIQDIRRKRLIQVPSRARRDQDSSHLRRKTVEDVTPVDSAPHVCCDGRDCLRAREISGERFGAEEGHEKKEWDFYDEHNCHGVDCPADETPDLTGCNVRLCVVDAGGEGGA